MVILMLIHGSYSFFTYMQVVGRIKWLEKILVTPSIHGLHHASDEKYLDKNYGDMFVFWDKMFVWPYASAEKPEFALAAF